MMADSAHFSLPGFTTGGKKRFWERSGKIVHNLNARMLKRGIMGGKLSLEEGRDVLARGLGEPCKYCGQKIKVSTMSLDHPTPVSKGGDPWSVECICAGCNREKGELTDQEFQKFLVHVLTYAPNTQAYFHRTMRSGGAFFRMQAAMRGMIKRTGTLKERVITAVIDA